MDMLELLSKKNGSICGLLAWAAAVLHSLPWLVKNTVLQAVIDCVWSGVEC